MADLVAVIAEVERLRLYAEAGYSSLFEFCVKDLRLSEDDAYKMAQSARAAGRRPEVLSFLAEGALTTRSLALLTMESKSDDFVALVDAARGKSVREVEKLVAARHADAPAREIVRPKSESTYRIAFDADEELKTLLDRARGLLRHKLPEGRIEGVLKEALARLVTALDPVEGTATRARPGARTNPRAREAPPSVRAEVWRRDGGRCVFVSEDGRRCDSKEWLEVDHVTPWARGGRSDDPANLRLLCRAHNQLEARRVFGGRAGPPADG